MTACNQTTEVKPKLSICIATFKRADFIGETLERIIPQLNDQVELLVVDGASPDHTPAVVEKLQAAHPQLLYFRENVNSGVDQDFDKAVGYASGDYCWLMTDDDLIAPNAIEKILHALNDQPALVIVNASVHNVDFSRCLAERTLNFNSDRQYRSTQDPSSFSDLARHLTFIGAVIIRRDVWMSRDRKKYFGTLFIHVGVIYQQPFIYNIKVLSEPLVQIRYGNAMWTPRSFEIWMFKWPALVWCFAHYDESNRLMITRKEPWRSFNQLAIYRAIGGYNYAEYKKFFSGMDFLSRISPWLCSMLPAKVANSIVSLYCVINRADRGVRIYDLTSSPHASFVTRLIFKLSRNRAR